jgi:glycine hydroxymethyltransferase
MLVDVTGKNLTGKQAEKALEAARIAVNKNAIPFDSNPPMTASGVRIGTPAVITRAMKQEEMKRIGALITAVLLEPESEVTRRKVSQDVETLAFLCPICGPRIEGYLRMHQAA